MLNVSVTESSQVGKARRLCVEAASAAGFDVTATGRVAIAATELATNLVKHGGGGEILCGTWPDATGTGLDLVALDRGRGMDDPQICLRDGYSSAGTPGTGLGAVRRQAQVFDIWSRPGAGTAVLARFAPASSHDPPAPLAPWGAICVSRAGETECGDGWAIAEDGGTRVLLLVDGLGHGPGAAEAARAACRRFEQAPFGPPASVLEAIHLALRPTRGAAAAVARVEPDRILFAGLGNIAGAVVVGHDIRRMVSHNGTVGHQARRIQEFEYPCPPGAVLVLHSDGIASSWWPPRQPGLFGIHPTLAAALLYRDHARGRDDCGVLVAQVGRLS